MCHNTVIYRYMKERNICRKNKKTLMKKSLKTIYLKLMMIFRQKKLPLGFLNFRICCTCYFHFFNPLPFIYQVDMFYNFLFFHKKFNLYLNGCRYYLFTAFHFSIPQFIKLQIISYYFQVYLKFIILYQTHFFANHNLMKLFIILLMKFGNR